MNIFQKTLEKIRHQQQLLAILIFFLVAVMIWIGVSLVNSQKRTKIDKKLQQLAKPLTPSLNTKIIDELEAKSVFSSESLNKFPIYMKLKNQAQVVEIGTVPSPNPTTNATSSSTTITPTPVPVTTPTATQSAKTKLTL